MPQRRVCSVCLGTRLAPWRSTDQDHHCLLDLTFSRQLTTVVAPYSSEEYSASIFRAEDEAKQ
jgi:hypothetical protein